MHVCAFVRGSRVPASCAGVEPTRFGAAGNLARRQVVPLDVFQKNAEQMLRDRTRLDPFLSQVLSTLPACER